MGPENVFYVLFLINDKKQRILYITRCITCLFRKSKVFTPILQNCQILQKWVTGQNEQSEKKKTASYSVSG